MKSFGPNLQLEFPMIMSIMTTLSFKTDFNVFAKAAWSPVEDLTLYGDLQYRTITLQSTMELKAI